MPSAYFGKTGIWNNTAQSDKVNISIGKTFFDFIKKSGRDGTVTAVMDQNFMAAFFFQDITNL